MKKLGALTIGQSPRPDIMDDLVPILEDNVEVVEAGALDGLTYEEVRALAPVGEEPFLITRFEGETVKIAEKYMTEMLQKKIFELEGLDVQAILLLCTGRFTTFETKVPFIAPGSLISAVVPVCSKNSFIGVLVPEEGQIEELRKAWLKVVNRVELINASPYGPIEDVIAAAKKLGSLGVDLIVPDCMGYTLNLKNAAATASEKPVILSKTLAARVVSELL